MMTFEDHKNKMRRRISSGINTIKTETNGRLREGGLPEEELNILLKYFDMNVQAFMEKLDGYTSEECHFSENNPLAALRIMIKDLQSTCSFLAFNTVEALLDSYGLLNINKLLLTMTYPVINYLGGYLAGAVAGYLRQIEDGEVKPIELSVEYPDFPSELLNINSKESFQEAMNIFKTVRDHSDLKKDYVIDFIKDIKPLMEGLTKDDFTKF